MILDYDKGTHRTIDEKLNSLLSNLQLAFQEVKDEQRRQGREIEKLTKMINSNSEQK